MADVAAHPRRAAAAAADRREPDRRRLAAVAQHGLDRRQPAAARALPLFPDARCALQQAHAGLGLRRDRRPQRRPRHPRHERSLRRHASVRPRGRRWWRSTPRCRCAVRGGERTLPGRGALPPAGRHAASRAHAAARRADPRGAGARLAPMRAGRAISRCAIAPPTSSRWSRPRPRSGHRGRRDPAGARSPCGGVGTRPWRMRACEERAGRQGTRSARPSKTAAELRGRRGAAAVRTTTTRSNCCRGPSSAPSKWPERSHDA